MSWLPLDVTQVLSDATPEPVGVAAAGTAGDASRSDHVHGLSGDAVRDAGRWEVVVDGTPASAVTNEAEDDWVYGWVAD
jgi:hypothetical protein